MPVQRCTLKTGKKGWKWGKSGKCYSTRADFIDAGLIAADWYLGK